MNEIRHPETAPAAHLVTVEADPAGGGVVVGHTKCDAKSFVPNMPGQSYCLSIDIIQAVIHHRCPDGQGDNDEPGGWVDP